MFPFGTPDGHAILVRKGMTFMKTVFIRESTDRSLPDASLFDLSEAQFHPCIGCWSCWWKTPGVCIHKDLEDFYRDYVNAGKVVFWAKPQQGFISSQMKSLFDRMIPLFLPYTTFRNGGTYHRPRYPRYPDIEFYYDYDFQDDEDYQIFHAYVYKVFEQFHAWRIKIAPVSDFEKEGVV